MTNPKRALLALAVLACANDDVAIPTRPEPPPPPNAMSVLSGDRQQGTLGSFLGEPFAVRVTDANGAGVARIRVAWNVTSGRGEVATGPGLPDSPTTTLTDSHGIARMWFRPLAPGVTSVTAEVPDLQGSPATFTVTSAGPAVLIIRFTSTWTSCSPKRFPEPEAAVPVGTHVEWWYEDYDMCAVRLVSLSVPPGASHFDSGIMSAPHWTRFRVSLDVAGDWLYRDAINGGTGAIRVRQGGP